MARKMIARRPRYDEATSGEILVGLAWAVLYIALIASGWVRDELTMLVDRGLPGVF
jgi:hypothetical protein